MAKEALLFPDLKEDILGYEVVKNGEVLFTDPTYAICNSWIINHAVAGVRPKPIRG